MSLEKELCRVVEHLGATDPVTATDLRRFAGKVCELLFPTVDLLLQGEESGEPDNEPGEPEGESGEPGESGELGADLEEPENDPRQ